MGAVWMLYKKTGMDKVPKHNGNGCQLGGKYTRVVGKRGDGGRVLKQQLTRSSQNKPPGIPPSQRQRKNNSSPDQCVRPETPTCRPSVTPTPFRFRFLRDTPTLVFTAVSCLLHSTRISPGRRMLGLLFLLRLPLIISGSGPITAEDPIEISGQLGSHLHLPVADACRLTGSYFDLFKATKKIGTYHGDLQPMKGYDGRLTYNSETCDITLKNLTDQDGTRFTVKFYQVINGKPTSYDIDYRINISGPLTSPPYIEDTIQPPAELTLPNAYQISTDDIRGFVSFCLSLDSPVNAMFPIVLWVIQKSCKKLDKVIGDSASRISSLLTIVFQFVTICTMSSGNLYSLLLFPIPILLLVDILKSLGGENKTKCMKTVLYGWRGILLLIQMLFAILVGILCNKFGDNLSPGSRIGFSFLSFLISFVLKIVVLVGVYFLWSTFLLFGLLH